MNKIKITSIKIENFKGIAKLNYTFEDDSTTIKGPNGSGKSTIKNAWEWCLCQTVDDCLPMLNNKEIPNLTTSVEICLKLNDNIDFKFTRQSIPKTTPRGRENKLVYKIDDIEIPKNIYVQKIAYILGAGAFENLPLLTDKDYFNTDTTKWKWTDRRKLLLRLSNAEDKCKDLLNNDSYDSIREYILKGFETSEIQSAIAKEKKELIKEQADNITRIQTKASELDELLSIDFDKIKKDLTIAKSKLTKLLKDPTSDSTKEISDNIYKLSKELDSLQAQDALTLKGLQTKMIEAYQQANDIYTMYAQINKNKIKCPHCEKEFVLGEKGEGNAEELEAAYESKKKEYAKIKSDIDNYKPNLKIKELTDMIASLKLDLENSKNEDARKSREDEIKAASNTVVSLEIELGKMTTLAKGKKQIDFWKEDNKDIADNLVQVEEKEMALQNYVKAQSKIISDSVNSMFGDDISWSLFGENYNGSIEQDCICLYNGKRYSSLSAGEKNKVNIEVTATLQKLFDVSLPMFVDNSEGCTLPVENVNSQLIWLVATKDETNIKATKITDLY